MVNVFDQFDTAQPAKASGNVFDQFDAKPQPVAPAGPSFAKSAMDLGYSFTPMGMVQGAANSVLHPMQSLQQADDRIRALANGASFGFADKIAAGGNSMLGYGSYADNLAQQRSADQQAFQRDPAGYTGAEAVGSFLPTSKLIGAGVTAANIPKIGGLLGMPIDGALLGGVQAVGNDQNIGEGMMLGGGLGVGAGLFGAGASKLINNSAMAGMRSAAPSFDDVAAQKTALYKQLQDGGVTFDANGYQQTLQNISNDLRNFRAAKAPQTADTLNSLSDLNGKSPSFTDLEDKIAEIKGTLRDSTASDTDKAASGIVLDHLNDFFNNGAVATNGSISAGDVPALAAQARESARRNILAKQLGRMADKSEWYLGGTESGMRNQVAAFGRRAGNTLTDPEKAAAQAVINREGIGGVLNAAGSKLGLLGSMASGGGGGLAIGGPIGGLLGMFAAPAASMASRAISNAATQRAVDNFGKTLLAGRAAQTGAQNAAALRIEALRPMIQYGLLGGVPAFWALQNGQ